jgi:RHS repeat-associated protein
VAAGLHQHYFDNAEQTLKVNSGDKLYAWVYLDPANVPEEVMLQWSEVTAGWRYKAYWGPNKLIWGGDEGTKISMGPLPQAGGWVKLEVPASALGLEGKELKGMAFTLYGGRANWDKAGKTRGIASSMPLDGLANIGYNPTNNRINTAGFAYDAAGNQTRTVVDASGGQQVSQYDCAGRLARVLDGSGNELARYVYGEGAQRLMSIEGGVTKFFAWAGGRIIAEYEASGANALIWKTSYVYLGGRLLATTSGAGGTETRFHHPDRLGTRLVTDAGGTVVSEQLTMPFGTMLPITQTYGGETSYQNPTLANPSKKRFTSYDRSDVTGLDYAVNRFYSPQQGRFTQVDPIEMDAASLSDPQTLNLYSYCGNDPINHLDPDGLFFGKLFGWIGNAFKWAFRVLAVVVAVVAVMAAAAVGQYWGSILITKGLVAALFGSSALLATAGWAPGKIGQIAGAIITGGLSLAGNFRTPNTFPDGTGVGAVSDFVKKKGKERKSKTKPAFIILRSVIFKPVNVHVMSAGRPEAVKWAKYMNCENEAHFNYKIGVAYIKEKYTDQERLGPTKASSYRANLWSTIGGIPYSAATGSPILEGAAIGYGLSIAGSVFEGWRMNGAEYLRETQVISDKYKNALRECGKLMK